MLATKRKNASVSKCQAAAIPSNAMQCVGTWTIPHSLQQKAGFAPGLGWEIGEYRCCRQQNREFSRWQPSLGVGVEPRHHVLLHPEMLWEEEDAKDRILAHEVKDPKGCFFQIISGNQAAFLGVAAHQISSCQGEELCGLCSPVLQLAKRHLQFRLYKPGQYQHIAPRADHHFQSSQAHWIKALTKRNICHSYSSLLNTSLGRFFNFSPLAFLILVLIMKGK